MRLLVVYHLLNGLKQTTFDKDPAQARHLNQLINDDGSETCACPERS